MSTHYECERELIRARRAGTACPIPWKAPSLRAGIAGTSTRKLDQDSIHGICQIAGSRIELEFVTASRHRYPLSSGIPPKSRRCLRKIVSPRRTIGIGEKERGAAQPVPPPRSHEKHLVESANRNLHNHLAWNWRFFDFGCGTVESYINHPESIVCTERLHRNTEPVRK